MAGIYKLGTSRLAHLSLWLARLTIPVAIISFLLMRFGGMHPSVAVYCFGSAIALALLAMLVSVAAFPAIWFEGQIGGSRLWGSFLRSQVIILPALALAFIYFTRPAFSDLSTNPIDPPGFIAAWDLRHDADNSLEVSSLEERELQALAYPDLESTILEQPPEIIYLIVQDELEKHGWELIGVTDQRDSESGGLFEAYTRSILTGLRYAMVVRLRSDGEYRTVVDMRSASYWGPHDLGLNARRITGFLKDVETRLESSLQHFELKLEQIVRKRRLELGPMPRPKPSRRVSPAAQVDPDGVTIPTKAGIGR